MGEVFVHRDDKNHVVGLAFRDVDEQTVVGMSAARFLQAVAASLSDYLHVDVVVSGETLSVDRSDTHLNREIDAILETLVIGLRMLEREAPTDLVVHEAKVEIEV